MTNPFAAGVVRPATSTQTAFWLIQNLDLTSPAYLLRQVFELHGPVDHDALAQSFRLLVARHEVLRTGFVPQDDELIQVVHAEVDLDLPVEDLSTEADVPSAVSAALDRETARLFDLTTPPLLRCRLLSTGPDSHLLVLTVHHIVVDDASLSLLWRELGEAYDAFRRRAEPALAPDPPQFEAFVRWEQDWLASAQYQAALRSWKAELADATPLRLPWAARPVDAAWRGGSHRRPLPAADAVRELSARHAASPFMTLLAVFGGVLYRWTGESDIVVGASVSLRDRPGFARIVGPLINSVALRTTWAGDPSLDEAVVRVRNTTLDALGRAQVPFDHVVAQLPHLRVRGENPVFQVMFSYFAGGHGAQGRLRLAGLRTRAAWLRPPVSKFALSLDCVVEDQGLSCAVAWNNRWFDDERGRLFSGHFAAAVGHAVRDPAARVGEWQLDRGPTDSAEPTSGG